MNVHCNNFGNLFSHTKQFLSADNCGDFLCMGPKNYIAN